MAGFRRTWEKAGPTALAALDEQFVPPPSTINRGTAFVLLDDKKKPHLVGVRAFSAPFDPLLFALKHRATISKLDSTSSCSSSSSGAEFPCDSAR